MIAVYDLATSPPQYDSAIFLVAAEIERIRRNEDGIDLIFAPGPNNGFRMKSLWPATTQEHRDLMRDLAMPMAGLLPSVRSVEWRTSRDGVEGHFGAGQKLYGFPRHLANLQSPHGRPLRAAGQRQDDLLTITLREAEHLPARNSNVPEWIMAAGELKDRGWRVVFVRDTRMADEGIEGFECRPDASRDVVERARLYCSARLNLFVNSGPAALAVYLNAPLANFRPASDAHRASSPAYMAQCGFPVGSQLPNSPPWQRYVWADDRADLIVATVEEMTA